MLQSGEKDIEEVALKESLAGNEVPGWKAVAGRTTRDWTDMDAAFAKLEADGHRGNLVGEAPSLAQVEKAVGKKIFAGKCKRIRNQEDWKAGTGGGHQIRDRLSPIRLAPRRRSQGGKRI